MATPINNNLQNLILSVDLSTEFYIQHNAQRGYNPNNSK